MENFKKILGIVKQFFSLSQPWHCTVVAAITFKIILFSLALRRLQ